MTRKRRNQPPPFDRYRNSILGMVRDLAKSFTKPTEDWLPTLFMVTPKSGALILGLGDVFENRESKAVLPLVVHQMFRKYRPALSALVMSAWHVRVEPTNPLAELAVEMNAVFGAGTSPNRTEVVLVEVASKDGEDEMWCAEIVRTTDKPPTLDQWERWDEGIHPVAGGSPAISGRRSVGGRFGKLLAHTFASLK